MFNKEKRKIIIDLFAWDALDKYVIKKDNLKLIRALQKKSIWPAYCHDYLNNASINEQNIIQSFIVCVSIEYGNKIYLLV